MGSTEAMTNQDHEPPDDADGSTDHRPRREKFSIAEMFVLVAGIALGLWVTAPIIGANYNPNGEGDPIEVVPVFVRVVVAVLGGLSLVGVPLLLMRLRRDRRRWQAGKVACGRRS